MAQFRQSGTERFSGRGGYQQYSNGASTSDHVTIGIRNGKASRWRRSARPDRFRRLRIGSVVFVLCVVLVVTVLAYYYISGFTSNGYDDKGFDSYDGDFLSNVTRIDPSKGLEFRKGSVVHGRDSRDWDKDDRRRDDDYNEDGVEHNKVVDEVKKDAPIHRPVHGIDWKGIGLYNEAGRNELKKYEAEYQASLGKGGESSKKNGGHREAVDMDVDDDDTIDSRNSQGDEYVDYGHDDEKNEELHKADRSMTKQHNTEKDDGATSKRSLGDSSIVITGGKSGKTSRSVAKRRYVHQMIVKDQLKFNFEDTFYPISILT